MTRCQHGGLLCWCPDIAIGEDGRGSPLCLAHGDGDMWFAAYGVHELEAIRAELIAEREDLSPARYVAALADVDEAIRIQRRRAA